MRAYEALISINLVEEREDETLDDEIGHYFWRWTYPSIDNGTRCFIEKLLISTSSSFSLSTKSYELGNYFNFYRFKEKWIYIQNIGNKSFFILLTKDFYPNHYQILLALFAKLYRNGNSMGQLLNYYLMLIIDDEILIQEAIDNDVKNLSFYNKNKLNMITSLSTNSTKLCSIIKLFSLDFILIYTALLLKKRIVVYHHDRRVLFDFVLALPEFIPHRIDTIHTVFVPNVDLYCAEQIDDLKARKHFISTFNDPKVEEYDELYDVYINLAAIELSISHKSKEIFLMTKTHKDVAISLVRVAENVNNSDINVINEIKRKTDDLLHVLHSLADENNQNVPNEHSDQHEWSSSLDKNAFIKKKLNEKLSSPNLEHFFWNLALAEGLATI